MPRVDFIKRAERWYAHGYAERTGADYEPFLKVREVPSRGRSHRIPSWTVGRLHHVLSDLEAGCFYIADYTPDITDIREQYPLLPLEETQAIALALGTKHPAIRGKPHVMTTDFLLTYGKGRLRPLSVKYAVDFDKTRTREKSEIERVYWARRTLTLQFATDYQVPKSLLLAIQWAHTYRTPDGIDTTPFSMEDVLAALDARLRNDPATPLTAVCAANDLEFGFPPGVSLTATRHAIANRRWDLDLRRGIDTLKPLPWRAEP